MVVYGRGNNVSRHSGTRTAQNCTELVDRIGDLINQGWEPQGGVSISLTNEKFGGTMVFAQAMVKRVE